LAPQVQVNKSAARRISMFLWGPPGCGKTHLAGTAPGKRLWINFDPDGTATLPYSEDTLVLDYANEPVNLVEQVKSVNPFDIEGIFKAHPDITTVVIDSVTRFSQMATEYGAKNAPGGKFENPGMAGYGYRNRFTIGLVSNMLVVTGKHNKNIIFIGHEGAAQTNEAGVIQLITILLGGSLATDVPLQISEVWHMRDVGGVRTVSVRPVGFIRPMKTRMFNTTSGYDFIASDKARPNKESLADLFGKWEANKYEKIELPK